MKRALAGFGVAVALMLAACAPVMAQDAGPRLTLRTAGGQTVFRMGERIPLELVFTGPGDGRYRIGWTGERVVGTGFDAVDVSPNGGWADPLRILYAMRGGFGGGGGSYLSAKPVIVSVNLNEWVRFDQPGTYQVEFTTQRVIALSAGGFQGKPVKLRSEPIEIKIVPATVAWQKAKLAEIESVLKQPVNKFAADTPERTAAIADLRFLGTAAAAVVMAKHLEAGDPLAYQCEWGLLGLPQALHQTALNDLNAEMEGPDFPISGNFLDTTAFLQVSDGPVASMRTEETRLRKQAWEAAFASLGSKEGKAQAETANALMVDQPGPLSEEQRRELGTVMAAGLTELPAMDQAQILQSQWSLIRSTNLLPLLEELGAAPLKTPNEHTSDDYAARQLKSAALERWFDLDPEGAKQEILREIGTPNPALMAQDLEFLPKEKLPQFEYMWAQQFAATNDAIFAGLLAKFGEGDAVGMVEAQAAAEIGKWACDSQNAALAYIAEFDPDNALPLVERAMHARGKDQTMCYRSMFQSIAEYATSPVLTKAAIDAVSDPDQQVMEDALIYLMEYGDASAKEAILSRYAGWTAQWRGRADELETQSSEGQFPLQEPHWQDIGFGQDLVQALLENQGWIATPELVARALAGCVGKQVCRMANSIADQVKRQPYEVQLSPMPHGTMTFSIGQYHIQSLELFEKKVAQFPKGTRFALIPWTNADSDGRKLQDNVKAIIVKHGMLLVPANGSFTTQ